SNVLLFGVVEEAEKNCLLKNATVAINPMFAGGGSSLKVPDFFAAELPMVSTITGIRGYGLIDGRHFLAADANSFPACLKRLLADGSLRTSLRRNALEYAKANVDWSVLGKRYLSALRGLTRHPRRLLVVTYRFTGLPLGGAEAYLDNLLRELAKIGAFSIDVATYDVGRIANKWHFSAEYGPADSAASPSAYVENLFRFPLDATDPVADFDACKKLFSMWMEESRIQGREFLDMFQAPILLGGWNFPEKRTDGTTTRWSSKLAEIYVGQSAKNLKMTGFVPKGRILTPCIGGEESGQSYSGAFDLCFPLTVGGHQIVQVVIDGASDFENDPRELGAHFHRIAIEDANGWREVSLGDDYASCALARDVDRWVRSLVSLTEKRAPEDDGLFVTVRGPHSSALKAWLEENIARYEVVLAQGVPFASSVDALEVSKTHHVPCVLLPHFHMEDKYYHWQSFYRAFRSADLVLATPRSAADSFFEPLGAKSHHVLGGGASGDEFLPEMLDKAAKAFLKVHTVNGLFILVLGRKAGGKNYRMVMDAVAQLNRRGHRLDLVMIGPDDDGVQIDEANVYYYGMQPRDVVVGALARCLCVVNMSGSESFGIVLIESWLAGRPVIAQRNCAAFAELVRDGENGFLAETDDEIAVAVSCYLDDEELARRFGDAGKTVAHAFTWNALAEDVNSCLLDTARRHA
ncbi:MAG: glycosyltransferase, partial [Acidobacteriota bacterium]